MPGKVRKCLRDKTLHNVLVSELSETDKNCIVEVFVHYEHMLDSATAKHGRWKITAGSLFPVHQCSECGYRTGRTRFCPNCGAKMDLKEGETK